jgi:Transglutaminase-like superfamily
MVRLSQFVLAIALILCASVQARGEPSLKAEDPVSLNGRGGILTRLDALPYVENEFTKRFKFDSYDNPKLKRLREEYRFDEVVAPGRDEYEKQLLLLDWVNHRFKKFGKPTSPARGALDILKANDAGNAFFCAHFADVFVSAAASLGWVDRSMALRRPDNVGEGSTEHSSTEIWSNQYRKWVMLDPTFAMYVEKDGAPLNAFEIRQEWFYRNGRDLVFVLDKDRKRYRKSDMPVFRGRYPDFGDLVLDAGALNPYAFIGYIPNTDLMTFGPDYGGMFITRDKLCDTTKWHQRVAPKDPAVDPYFPINQSAMSLTVDGASLHVGLRTMTPNFKAYRMRIDGGEWARTGDSFTWTPHPGTNRLEVKTVNQFGLDGPVSTAELEVDESR